VRGIDLAARGARRYATLVHGTLETGLVAAEMSARACAFSRTPKRMSAGMILALDRPPCRSSVLRGSKLQLWEGGIRVPFFVSWQGRIPAGGVTHDPVSSLDVLPTALAAAGVAVREDSSLDGVNLLPWLEGRESAPKRGPLYWKFGAGQSAIRDGDMKLVRVSAEEGLFDVRQDIGETTDRTAARPMLARQLEAAWKKWDADNLSPERPPRATRTKEPAGADDLPKNLAKPPPSAGEERRELSKSERSTADHPTTP
jgi:hypothetical protein